MQLEAVVLRRIERMRGARAVAYAGVDTDQERRIDSVCRGRTVPAGTGQRCGPGAACASPGLGNEDSILGPVPLGNGITASLADEGPPVHPDVGPHRRRDGAKDEEGQQSEYHEVSPS